MNSEAIIECVPNFSEGTDLNKVTQIVAAMQVDGVRLLDWSLDKAHNRSVVTIAGSSSGIVEAAVRAAGKAAELIDLTAQSGVHPRIGAADVIPFIPVSGASLAECAVLARQAGLLIWRRYGVPVYFYGAAAARPDRVQLEDVRRGQFEGLRDAADVTPPDGPISEARSSMRPPEPVPSERAASSSRTTSTSKNQISPPHAQSPAISAPQTVDSMASRL